MSTAHPKRGRERDIDLATPFHNLPGSLLVSTARRLADLGFDERLAAAIRKPANTKRVRELLGQLKGEICESGLGCTLSCCTVPSEGVVSPRRTRQRPSLIHGRYTPPELQLANVRMWNEQRKWGIPEDWFTTLGPAPAWPDGRLRCVTLEVALYAQPEERGMGVDGLSYVIPAIPGMIRTVREFWDIISHQHPNASKLDQFHLDAEHLELIEGTTYEPGLQWRVLDLGANWDKKDGIRPIDVRNPLTSPNVDGFAALAHHPKFVRSMSSKSTPCLLLSGFVIPDGSAPLMFFDQRSREMRLSLVPEDEWGNTDCAVPARLGV